MKDKLTDRKMRILRFVIDEYFVTAEPVGSRTISKNEDLGVSAATVRNEMADLEEMGFLKQPYISAGRIPSPKAYSLYVEEIMQARGISDNLRSKIKSSISDNIDNMEILMNDTISLLSEVTSLITLGVSKKEGDKICKISHFDLVNLSESKVVMILVMSDGEVKSSPIFFNENIDPGKLSLIASTLRDSIIGRELKEISPEFISYIKGKVSEYSKVVDNIVNELIEKDDKGFTIMLRGQTNIFDYPEFSNKDFAKDFLNMLSNEDNVLNLISSKGVDKDGVNIVIGDESKGELLENVSIMTADFGKNGSANSRIGIVGPRRMDYDSIFSLLNYLSKIINGDE